MMGAKHQRTLRTDPGLFWAKVNRRGPDECWPWTGAKHKQGYGRVAQWPESKTDLRAHRLALMFSGVDVPADKMVLHSCDNPPCCNPAHLRVGTHLDNSRDCVERGRASSLAGELSPKARLTLVQVREIRELLAQGEYQYRIAARYGLAQTTVSAINRHATWVHD